MSRIDTGSWLAGGVRGGMLVAAVLSAFATAARANLATAFVGKVAVDTTYVTAAPSATDIAFAADGRAVITRKTGQVMIRRLDGSLVEIAYPFGGTLDTASEKGLLGVVADPDVATNATFYFFVSNGPTTDKHRVMRATLGTDDTLTVDPTPVIAAARGVGPGLEGPANHDGGGLWIHARQLYVSVGDTGANASPPTNKYGSCLNKGNGKILRVNLDGSVPADNPLVGLAAVTSCTSPTSAWGTAAPDPRIFAWGFRNPWRFSVDAQTGLLWVGDVGESTQEEISVGGGDQHYGYPFVEGTQAWGNLQGKNCDLDFTPPRACLAPVFAYPHPTGFAVTGGILLDSPAWTAALGGVRYVYGDSSVNFVRLLQVNGPRTGLASTTPIDFASFTGRPVSFRPGPDGALYVVYLQTGDVFRFAPLPAACSSCDVARVPLAPAGLLALLGGTLLLGVRGRLGRRD